MNEESTTAVAEAPTEAPSEVNRIGAILDASLGIDANVPNEESSDQPANAPADGNPKDENPDAPDAGEPASTEDETAKGKQPDAEDDKKAAEDDNSTLNALLDADPAETSDDPGVWKGRYSDATRHIGELNERLKSINDVLLSQGRQIVQTAKGFEIAVTEEARQVTSDAVNAKAIYASLTQTEKDMFIDDPEQAAKMLVDKAVNKIAETYMPATAKTSDAVLSQADADHVYDDFVACKLPDGKTARFPDADNAEVKELMAKAYNANTPAMERFRDLASKSKDMQYALLEYLYNKVYRAKQMQSTMQAARRKATNETQEKHRKESSLSSSGSSGTVAGQRSNIRQSESDRLNKILDTQLG